MIITRRKMITLSGLFVLLSALAVTHVAADVRIESAWKLDTQSAIYSGVRLDGERLYAGGENGVLMAVETESGEIAWRYEAGAAIRSAVASDDQRVYFHSSDGVVHALSKKDGSLLWKFTTDGERQWDYWDYYLSTPAVDDRQVYFGSGDHHIYALEKRTGDLRWKVRTGNIVHGEPVISGEKVIIGGFDGHMYAIDRGNGRLLWTFKTVGNAYFRNGEIPGAATVADGLVYFGTRDYNIYALLEDTGTGAWNVRTPSWVVGRPLVVDEAVVVVNSDGSMVYSYERKSGKQNWQYKNSYNMFAGASVLGENHLAVAGLDGRITVLSRADGKPAGTYDNGASRAMRKKYFKEDGTLDYTGIATLDDLMDLYDRQLADMGGIAGELAVDGTTVYYATVSGEIAALRVNGLE